MKIAFVTTFCSHYRIRFFEALHARRDAEFYFFSAGDEWYWQQAQGVRAGRFPFRYLWGFRIGATRITPTLPFLLAGGGYAAYVKCINGRFALPVTYVVARLRGRPFILWSGIWAPVHTRMHRLFHGVTRHIYRHADAVVAYGDHVRRHLIGEGVRPDRIFLAPNAVENGVYGRTVSEGEREAVRRTAGAGPTDRIVLYVGRLEPGKGLEVLMDAFLAAGHPEAILVLVGDGALRGRLEAAAREPSAAGRIRFVGPVRDAETVAWYAAADLLVLPSVTTPVFKEPWGLVVNEAFNQGVPVVATDAVGAAAAGLVRHGENGLVVPEGDRAALANAIARLLDDETLRSRLGGEGRRAVAAYTPERMAAGFLQALAFVGEGTSPGPQTGAGR